MSDVVTTFLCQRAGCAFTTHDATAADDHRENVHGEVGTFVTVG